jgi:tape measure domain-containing protein
VAVVAGVKIDVDARGAAQKLRQFQQQSTAAGRAAEQLQGATGKVGREMRTAANGMRFFIDAAGRARKENGQFVTTAEAAAAGLKKQGQAAGKATGALRGLGGAIASIGAGALVAGMVRGAASAEQLQLRLKLLSKEYGETERVQRFVAQSAKTFGQSQTEAASGVADVYARLRPLGTTLDQIQVVYNGFNAVALASGVSAEAASGAFLQLSQALGSGTLQGDEFRSIAEQVPGILRLVSSELGVSVGQLKKLGSEGKITSDVLINALARGFDENQGKIQELLALSPAQRFKEFRNATQELSNALGSELLPALTPIVQTATEILRLFGQLPGPVKTLAAAVLGLTAAFVALAPAINAVLALAGTGAWTTLLAAGPWIALAGGIAVAVGALASYRSEAEKLAGAAAAGGAPAVAAARNAAAQKGQEISLLEQQRKTASGRERGSIDRRLATLRSERANLLQSARAGDVAGGTEAAAAAALPSGGGAAAGGKTGRTGGGKADKAAAEAARAAEQQAQQLKSAQDLLFTQTNQLALLRAQNEYQSAFVTFGNTRAEIERKYNELLAQSKSQQETQLLQQARAAEYKQSSLTLEQRILDLNRQATQPLDDILNRLKDQAAYEREYGELIKNGTNAELAKQIIEINRAYEASVEALQPALAAAQAAVTKAEAEGASATEIEKYRKELERIQELQGGGLAKKRDEAVGAATAGQAKTPSVMDNIGEKIKQLKAELEPVKLATDTIVGGATAIGNAFGQAFQDVATGAKSTQEALADAFKGIGEAFISMAAEIIAKQLVMILLQTIFNALSGMGGGALGKANKNLTGAGALKTPIPGLKVGGYAEGGFVTGPTQALIGEGGEPEYVIPQSKMTAAMSRYSRGARGEAVIPGSGGSEAATGGGTAVATAPIDVRYTVERINSVDYVTADQFQVGMRQAAEQGARRGEQRALTNLRQNTSTRRRIGL